MFFAPAAVALLLWALVFWKRPRGDHMVTHLLTIAVGIALLVVPPASAALAAGPDSVVDGRDLVSYSLSVRAHSRATALLYARSLTGFPAVE